METTAFMNKVNRDVCFISYNSRGFSSIKIDFIKHLISQEVVGSKLPIICNQENFLLRDNSYKIIKALPGYQVLINPAIKISHDKGRPRNGMFIAFPSTIKNTVTDVSPGSWRIQAAKFQFGNSTILLINSYFPVDQRRANADEAELQETISQIKEVIRKNDFHSLLWAGDINADFLRDTSHTDSVLAAIQDLGLSMSWEKFQIDFTHCVDQLGVSHTAILDHFFWSEAMCEAVTDAGVIHLPDNKSDHCPIYCTLRPQAIQLEFSESARQQSKPSWKKATSEQKDDFKAILEEKLSQLVTPVSLIHCRDTQCRDIEHTNDLDQFTVNLLETVQEVAEMCLPVPGTSSSNSSREKKVQSGWMGEVKPFREDAYFWHQVWTSCGRPQNTEVHKIMKRTRNRYHYEYKKCRKAEEKLKRSNLLDACLNGGGDLFQELKSFRKHSTVVATSMDGVSHNIKEHFKTKYQQLYNSANDGDEILNVQAETNELVDENSLCDVMKVTTQLVKEAAHKLKPGKSDPVYSFSTDCFKNASDTLFEKLSLVIKSFLVHGHVTLVLLLATLVPIIKDKLGSINVSKNYRSIAISSILLKIIDWIFIILFGTTFGLNDFQYAYQAGCSTTMCTWAVVETVDYFLHRGSEVFTCAMDMTAAFDLTLHSLLFSKMNAKGFPAIFIRLFIFIYVNQIASVRWNGEVSSEFPMRNGCRQGAVLSAIAYCFYCEELFALLKRRRTGCWVQDQYHGIFGYSDDNWLLAPSLGALQDMLKTCEEYASVHNLKFSTDTNPEKCKTKLMAFLKKPRILPSLELCGNPLPWVDKIKHLGNTISNVMDGNQMDCKVKTAKYIDKNNTLCQEFFFAHPQSKVAINNIYNSHFTGCQLWRFGTRQMEKLESTYNRSIKIMLDLPWATHRYFMEPLTGLPHVSKILVQRYLSFISKIEKSSKTALRKLLSIVRSDVRTTTGFNLRKIMLQSGKNSIDDVGPGKVHLDYHTVPEDQAWRIQYVKELIDVKFDKLTVPEMTKTELDKILELMCTG